MKKEITIFHQFDPNGNRIGGIGKYILSFIKHSPPGYDIKLVGITQHRSELFKWKEIVISGRVVQFIAVCTIGNENSRESIPVTLRYVAGLAKARVITNFHGNFFFQRFEYVIPFLFTKNKKFLIIHNDIQKQLDPNSSEFLWSKAPWLFRGIFGRLLNQFRHVFSVNSASLEFINSQYPKRISNRSSLSPTWAEDIFYRPSASEKQIARDDIGVRYGIEEFKYRLIFVGRFQKQKNIDLLLSSLLSLESCVLLMAGEGDEMQRIRDIVRDRGIQKQVIFLGNVPHAELPKYIYSSDAYVSSSNFEGMSVALIEALQTGTPVVTTPTGETQKIIINGQNGIVTEGWDPIEFSKSITSVLSFTHNIEEACTLSVSNYKPAVIIKSIFEKII